MVGTLIAPAVRAQQGGTATEWDIRKDLAAFNTTVQRVKPVLDQFRPLDWVQRGAPPVYETQLKNCRGELDNMGISIRNFSERPEKLTVALEAFFRMQSLELMLSSLSTGVRKYQNPALADLVEGYLGESAAGRDKLRQHIVELANAQEQELKVMDEEAQRCRGSLSRAPQPAAKKSEPSRKEGLK